MLVGFETSWTFCSLVLINSVSIPEDTIMSRGVFFSEAALKSLNNGKRRPLMPLNWADRKNKIKKDAGEEYIIKKGRLAGKKIPAMQEPTGNKPCTKCKKPGCMLQAPVYVRFWKQFRSMDANQQNQILAECLDINDPKERRVEAENVKKLKKHTYGYSLKVDGKRFPVCRKRLLNTFGITNNRLRTIISKMERGDITFEDGRGKTCGVHPKLYSNEFKDKIRCHIESFPSYESHYCRGNAGSERRYLDDELSVTKMVSLFNEAQTQNGDRICKFDTYNHIFKTEFDLRFGLPRKDTCNFCDGQKAMIARNNNAAEAEVLEQALLLHQEVAKSARTMHKLDGNAGDDVVSITADMQKVLFVPRLTCSSAYFKRKLSTFNLGIHKTGMEDADMYIWNETIAEHASKDVLSCVFKYITSSLQKLAPRQERTFILWSDRFVGQFNNCYLVLFMKWLVDAKYFTTVEHKFFVTGHSWMSCDRDFGLIEKRYKELSPLVPDDIEQVIKSARVNKPFRVTKMLQKDFKDFNILPNYVRLPGNLHVTRFHWFKYEKSSPNIIHAKSFHNSPDWQTFQLVMKTSTGFTNLRIFPSAYKNVIRINEAKAKDLRDLMEKIPDAEKYLFYDNLTKFVLS